MAAAERRPAGIQVRKRALRGWGLGIWPAAALVLPPLLWLAAAIVRSAALPGGPLLDPVARAMLLRSVQVALLAAGTAVLLGVPYGWIAARLRVPGSPGGKRWIGRILTGASVLPILLPPYVACLAWNLFLAREGWLNTLLLAWGWIREPIGLHGSILAAGAILASIYWPVIAWFTMFAARSVPRPLEDSARLHLPEERAAWWSAGPALRNSLPAGALLVFLLALADFGVPNGLGVATYPVDIVNRFQLDRDPGVIARIALPLPLLVIPLVALQSRWLRRAAPGAAETDRSLPAAPPGGSGARGWTSLAFCALVLAGSSFIPLGVLAAYSLPLETYPAVAAESPYHLLNSAVTAGAAAGIASLLALLYGWSARGRRLPVLDLALTLPYAIPGSLIAVGMLQILAAAEATAWLYDSLGGLVWTYVALFFPFALKSQQPAWERLDRELLDEGAVLGASAWTQFRATAWPVLRPYAILGGGLVALLSAREIDATALVRPPDGETIAFRIYDYLHFAPGPKVAALGLLLVLTSAAVTAFLVAWARSDRS